MIVWGLLIISVIEAYLKESTMMDHCDSLDSDFSYNDPSLASSTIPTNMDAVAVEYGSDEELSRNRRHDQRDSIKFGIPSTPNHTSKITIPSQKDVETYLIERRKQDLLERYG
jgi:hypothetical protein